MFYVKIISLKTFLVSNIIILCYWYKNFFSQIFFFSLQILKKCKIVNERAFCSSGKKTGLIVLKALNVLAHVKKHMSGFDVLSKHLNTFL